MDAHKIKVRLQLTLWVEMTFYFYFGNLQKKSENRKCSYEQYSESLQKCSESHQKLCYLYDFTREISSYELHC